MCYAVQVQVKLHTPVMLRCSSSCEVAHASDATLWYGVEVGLGGVGHVHVHVKLHTPWRLRHSTRLACYCVTYL